MENFTIPNNLQIIKYKNLKYTTIIKERQYLYTFIEKKSATNCAKFLSEYSHKYGRWPVLNNFFTNEIVETQLIEPSKRIPVNTLLESLDIEEKPFEYLSNISLYTGMGLMGVTEFNYNIIQNKIHINFKGAELDVMDKEPNIIDTINMLNNIIKE